MQVSTMTPRGDTTVENDINDEPQSARSAPPPRLTYSEKLMRTRERRNTIVEMEQEKAIHRGNEKANYKSHLASCSYHVVLNLCDSLVEVESR